MIRRAAALKDWGFVFNELNMQGDQVEKERHRSINSEQPVMPHWDDKKIEEAFSKKTFSLKGLTKAYVSEIEKSVILDALGKTHWNRKLTAQALGVSYKTLLTRIDELGIESKQSQSQLESSFI